MLDRQFLERRDRIADSRMRYKQFLLDIRKDSASEDDSEDELEDEWIEKYDEKARRKFWVHSVTGQTVTDEPATKWLIENSLLEQRVRIYWVVQGNWFDGVITKFHRRTRRHRIEYDDGDHEWLNLDQEKDRIQVTSSIQHLASQSAFCFLRHRT